MQGPGPGAGATKSKAHPRRVFPTSRDAWRQLSAALLWASVERP